MNGRSLQEQALQQAHIQGISGGLYQTRETREVKDPTVSDAQDAIVALRKRKDQIARELAEMKDRGPRLEAEAARIDRMLAAAAPVEP